MLRKETLSQPETWNLKEVLSKLEAKKEAASLHSKTQEENNNLKDKMQLKLHGLSSAKEMCEVMQMTNQPLHSELERLKMITREKEEEAEKLNPSLQSDQIEKMQSEMEHLSLQNKLKEDYERMNVLAKIEKEMERIEGRMKLEDQNRFSNSIVSCLPDEIKNGGERWDDLERRNKSLNLEPERMIQRHRESEVMMRTLGGVIKRVIEEKEDLPMSLNSGDIQDFTLEIMNHSLEKVKQRWRECEEEVKMNIETPSFSLQEAQLQKMKSELEKQSMEKAPWETQERMKSLSEENENLLGETKKIKEGHKILSLYLETGENRYFSVEGKDQPLFLDLEKIKRKPEVERMCVHLEKVKLQKVQAEMKKIKLERELGRTKEEYTNLIFRLGAKEKELDKKIGELERLQAHLQKMQEQTIHSSIEKQLAETSERLNDLHLQKERLETQVIRSREENKSLNEQNHLANSRIIQLQDEIISLNDMKRRLEDEISLHLEEKRHAQEELSRMKHDRCEQDSRHISLTEQIQTVSSNVESLQALVQELRGSNFELKEIIKNHEDVRALCNENLRQLQKMTEKNSLLEKSLSTANAELERQWEEEKLEMSSENLHSNIERLVGRKNMLENSLCIGNAEIEELRTKMIELNASNKFLTGENENLEAKMGSLVSEVNSSISIFYF
jgi:hypothetical protein